MAEETKVVLAVDTVQAATSIKGLRDNVKALKDDLVGLDKGTDDYQRTLARLTQEQNKIISINADVAASTMTVQQQFNSVARVGAGLAGGFNAVRGAMNLLGTDSEALNQTFVQLQAGMALVQGAQALGGLPKSLKSARVAFGSLTKTMMANPFIAIATLILAVGAALVAWGNSAAEAKSGAAQLNAEWEKTKTTLEANSVAQNHEINLMKARGASTLEVLAAQKQFTQEQIAATKTELALRQAEITALENKNKAWFSGERKRLKALKSIQKEEQEMYDKLLKELDSISNQGEVEAIRLETEKGKKVLAAQKAFGETYKATAADIAKRSRDALYNDATEDGRIGILNKELDTLKAQAAEYKKLADDASASWETRSKNADLYRSALNNIAATETVLAGVEQSRKDKQLEIEKTYAAIADEAAKRSRDAIYNTSSEAGQLKILSGELATLKSKAEEYSALANDDSLSWEKRAEYVKLYGETLSAVGETEADIANVEQSRREKQLEFEQLYAEATEGSKTGEERLAQIQEEMALQLAVANNEELAYDQRMEAIEAYMKLQQEALKTEQDLANKEKKLNSEKLKVTASFLSSASTLIGENTVAGKAMSVAAATVNTYEAASKALAAYPPPFSYVAMAATVAAGIANVKSILSTKVPGTSDTTSTAAATLPTIAVEDYYQAPIQQTSQVLTATEEQELRGSSKVYVTETDINSTMNRVNVTETESAFG